MKMDRLRRSKMRHMVEGEHAERGASLVEVLIFMVIFTLILFAVYDAYTNFQAAMVRNETRAKIQDDARRSLEQILRELRMAGYGVPTADDPAPVSAIPAASATSVTFLTTESGATTNLTAGANVGDTTLSVASTAGFQVNDPIYVMDEAKYRSATVTAVGATSLTITPAIPAPVPPFLTAGFTDGATVARQPRQITYSYAGGTLFRDLGDGGGPQPVIAGVSSLSFGYFDASNNPVAVPGGNLDAIRRIVAEMTVSATPPGQPGLGFTAKSDIRIRNR